MAFCSHCGEPLNMGSTDGAEKPIQAVVEIGEYCFDEDTFDYESKYDVLTCPKCHGSTIMLSIGKSELETIQAA